MLVGLPRFRHMRSDWVLRRTRYPLPVIPCMLINVFIEIDHLRIYVEQAGQGPPVLLLHGWQNSARTLASIRDALTPSHRVWALDLPGFGLSSAPPETWGTYEYADFVRHAMQRLEIEHADLLGHSRGGAIGIVLAAQSPNLIDRLVLVGSAGLRAPRTLALRLRGQTARNARRLLDRPLTGRAGRRVLNWLYGQLGMSDYRDAGPLRATFVKMVNQDLRLLLPQIQAPVLLLWGARDQETPLWMGRQMAAAIPKAELVVFEQAGHFVFLEEREAFNHTLLGFLSGSVLTAP